MSNFPVVLSALEEFVTNSNDLLARTHQLFADKSVQELLSKKVNVLDSTSLTNYYHCLLQRLSVKTRADVDLVIKSHYRSNAVQKLHDELLEFEANWNKLLLTLEESIPVAAEQLPTSVDGSSITSIPLINADDETAVTLADYFHYPKSCQFLVIVLLRHFA